MIKTSEQDITVSIINEAAVCINASIIGKPIKIREPIVDELHGIALEMQAAQARNEDVYAIATYRVQVVNDDGSSNGKPHYKDTKEDLERDLHALHDDGYKTVVTPLYAKVNA